MLTSSPVLDSLSMFHSTLELSIATEPRFVPPS
jgi:hypothetical protein